MTTERRQLVGCLVSTTRGHVVAETVYQCDRWWERAVGLLAGAPLRNGEALWLEPCNGVHTWGMRYAIDVVTLDRTLRVLRVDREVRPWRWVPPTRGGRVTVEMSAGSVASSLSLGDQLRLEGG